VKVPTFFSIFGVFLSLSLWEKFFKRLSKVSLLYSRARLRFPLKKKSCEKKSRGAFLKMSSRKRNDRRVETLDGHRGFCRYVGPVTGQTGTWVGIEWDDSNRGKHDGKHDGERYFECKRKGKEEETKRASFVRVQKVAPGTDFVSAAKEKYEFESQDAQLEKRLVFGGKAKKTDENEEEDVTIELKTKLSLQKKLNELERILLPNARLERVTGRAARTEDDEGEEARPSSSSSSLNEEEGEEVLAKTFNANATHVDVSGNLMTSFVELGKIGKYFRNLEILDASDAYYDEDVGDIESGDASALAKEVALAASQFRNLKTLALNKTRTSWAKALLIIDQMPNLEELRLDRNELQNIAAVDERASRKYFPKVKVLSLDGNTCIKWDDLWALRFLPSLETLYASDCSVEHIAYQDDDENNNNNTNTNDDDKRFFRNLRGLFLGYNRVRSWQSVDVIDHFPRLECVRLSHNPFCENDSASRHEIVARAGKLLSLNASEITERERRESEIRYLRNVVAEVSSTSSIRLEDKELDAKMSSDEVLAKHPRAKALKEMHGERALAGVQTTKTTQSQQQLESRESGNGTSTNGGGASSSISLALTLTREGKGSKDRTFPKNVTVARVKTTCEKLFGMKLGTSTLAIRDRDEDETEKYTELEPDEDTLAYLGVESGAEIFVL
jgi:Leucine-rich repeat (LRR) protein